MILIILNRRSLYSGYSKDYRPVNRGFRFSLKACLPS